MRDAVGDRNAGGDVFMATTTRIPVSEYLHSSWNPDCDYVDGELQERNVGEIEHAKMQAAVTAWFYQHRKEWKLEVLSEVRIQVSDTRFRVVDVCLVSSENKDPQIVQHAPLAIIEILSPEDRISRYQERLADYRQMGIPNLWVIDPQGRRGYDCSTASWIETVNFKVLGTSIRLDLQTICAELDTPA